MGARILGRMFAMAALAALSTSGVHAAQSLDSHLHKSWSAVDGLPESPVWAIAQDPDGYIWLGVHGGLVRFDGARFVRWEALTGAQLPERDVHALHVARDGSLWVGFGNTGGVSRIRDGGVQSYPPGEGLQSGPIWAVFEDRHGVVWAGGTFGVSRFRDGRWERVGDGHGIRDEVMLFGFHEDAAGDLLLATVAGLYRHDRAADRLQRIVDAGLVVRSVTSDSAGSIWVGGELDGLRAIGPRRASGAERRLPDISFPLLRDERGHLWGGTPGGGVARIRDRAWADAAPVERITPRDGLSGDRILALHEDRTGNIWIGTNAGLDYLAASSPGPYVMRPALSDKRIASLAAGDGGAVWAAAFDGLYLVSEAETTRYGAADGLPADAASVVHRDKRGNVWVTSLGRLHRFDDGRFAPVALPEGMNLFRVTAMTGDGEGGLWLCDATGLYRLQDGVLTDYGDAPAVRGRTPVVAYTDSLDRVWIGFLGGGVVAFDKGQPREFHGDDAVTAGSVSAFLEDRDGTLWVASHTGLARFDGNRFEGLSGRDRPGGYGLIGISQDDEGFLWAATTEHLLRFSPGEFSRALVDPSYRLAVLHELGPGSRRTDWWTSYQASARTTDGRIWFATNEGAVVVDPRRVGYGEPPAVRVDRVRRGQRVLAPGDGVRLPARANRLEFEYSAPAFDAPARYRYMLEGFDTEWVEVGAYAQAVYTNLPPGEYRFRVAASASGTRWVEASPWDVSVLPAIYETAAFRAGLVLALALIIVGMWRLRVRRLRKQFALVLGERARVGREIHDTLLQGMAGVAMQVHSAAEALDNSQPRIRATLQTARDALEHYMREARRSIWELRGPALESLDLPAAIEALGQRLTAGTAIRFGLRVRGAPRRCAPELKQQLLRVSGEAISNAVQHAGPAEIAVELAYTNDSVGVCVRDDGRGFDVEQVEREPVRHWGVAGMRERAAQLGAALDLVSAPAAGTRVEIVAPLVEAE